MPDFIQQYSSLDNLLGYATGTARQPEEAKPTLPMPGIGAPMSDMAAYGVFQDAAEAQQPHVPAFIPHVTPAAATVAPVPRPVPTGGSNDQVGIVRDALRRVESGGNYQAKNKHTTASGAYQYTDGTWNNYGGYKSARYAPQAVQDARANEDLIKSLRKFNGDPFAVIANHMLPIQAKTPWLWTQPSRLQNGKDRNGNPKYITVPPVIDYVRKVVKGTPYENELNAYMAAYLPRQRG